MKKSGKCPRCESVRIGFLPKTYDVTDAGCQVDRSLAMDAEAQGLLFKTKQARVFVELYICTDCGYVEEYVKDLATIEWETLEGFQWHRPANPETEGPFR